jgi:hypothetical protein
MTLQALSSVVLNQFTYPYTTESVRLFIFVHMHNLYSVHKYSRKAAGHVTE